ncbi:MAG: hypothetical protein ACOZE5_03940 [Verrucomicrobiota bacterium]
MNEASPSAEEEERELRGQVELAQACAWLSGVIALAVLISNFGSAPKELEAARASAAGHRQMAAAHEQMLRDTEAALRQTEEALARVRASRSTMP